MTGEVCIANIGPLQRRRRLLFGVFMAVAAVVFLLASSTLEFPRGARLLVGVPVWMAALGFLQHREKT